MKARHVAEVEGVVLMELDVFRDARGFFTERYHRSNFRELNLPTDFVQDNHSRSLPGVLRGLHYQVQSPQGKLVGVIRGRIWDVVVDIRPASRTYGNHFGVEVSDDNGLLLWIPAGFAHGFCVLGDEPADVVYKVDTPYNPAGQRGIFWADPDLAIPWPISQPLISAKDHELPSFASYRAAPASFGS